MRKMKGYPVACFNDLNTSLKSSFLSRIWGFETRSSVIFGYETLTEIINSERKGKEAEQLAVGLLNPLKDWWE